MVIVKEYLCACDIGGKHDCRSFGRVRCLDNFYFFFHNSFNSLFENGEP